MNNSKINQAFLSEYLELDKLCAERFDTKSGITEYIRKLTDVRFASGRENALHRLTKYRSIRNRIAHEPGAIKNIDTVAKGDISWLKAFTKDVKRGKDPLSVYLKAASKRAGRGALKRTLILAGILAAALAVIVIAAFILF
ncbi:MAG: hypothetical protein IKJ13_03705 [Clostridia bacterium]|nr:hypothetical protein [Clostridia bacterium]MBO5316381.1 hypothetical protein [Clostridia bacterium]MBR3805923.1 hypothetical protein [Clostridia bacterium]